MFVMSTFFKRFSPSEQKLRSMYRLGVIAGRKQMQSEGAAFQHVPFALHIAEQTPAQPAVITTEPLPSQSRQEGATKALRSGTLLHMRNTHRRFLERLGRTRLVLLNPEFLNSSAADHDLLFSDAPTELVLVIRPKKALPDVG